MVEPEERKVVAYDRSVKTRRNKPECSITGINPGENEISGMGDETTLAGD